MIRHDDGRCQEPHAGHASQVALRPPLRKSYASKQTTVMYRKPVWTDQKKPPSQL